MEKVFKNGVKITAPDDVTIVFSSASEKDYDSEAAEGYVVGNKAIAGGLILGAVDEFYKNCTDSERKLFSSALCDILHSYPTKGLKIENIVIKQGAKLEDEEDE